MGEYDLKGILAIFLPVLGAIAASFFTFLAGRGKGKADAAKITAEAETGVRSSVTAGFQMLVSELQKERSELVKVVDAQSEEIVQLRSDVRTLTRQVARLENLLIRHGVDLPAEANAPSV